MAQDAHPSQHRLAVLDETNRLLITCASGVRRLPRAVFEDGPDPVNLARATAEVAGIPCGPPRRVVVGGTRYLIHVFRGSGEPNSPTAQWRPLPDLDDLDDLDDLADLDEPADVRAAVAQMLAEQTGSAPVPERRPQWWQPGWADRIDSWIDDQLATIGRARAGPSTTVKMWSLSAILRIPTVGADRVYAKATCALFAAEPRITRTIAGLFPQWTPTVLATDESRAWLLLDQLPGLAVGEAGSWQQSAPDLAVVVAAVHARMQVDAVAYLGLLREAGCPDRRLGPMLAGLDHLVEDSIEAPLLTVAERAALRTNRAWAADQLRELAGCGLPWTLVHGDLHLGNVASDGDRLVIYDWTDACLSHPFIDAVHLGMHGPGGLKHGPWREAYLRPWRERYPEADVERAMQLAEVANVIFQVSSYEAILASQEVESRFELGGVIAMLLRKLLAMAP